MKKNTSLCSNLTVKAPQPHFCNCPIYLIRPAGLMAISRHTKNRLKEFLGKYAVTFFDSLNFNQ